MTNADQRAEVVRAFCDECVWVRSIRTHFTDLFEVSERRNELLSKAANTFFGDLHLLLIDYIILQKCKLTDPASDRKGVSKNLTTNYILELNWSAETKAALAVENTRLMNFRKKIIDARNRLISHLDLRTRMQAVGLGQFSEREEQDFWDALQAFVNVAHEEAIGGPYEINAVMQEGDVASLVHYLKDGMDYTDLVDHENGFLLSRIGKRRFDDA